MKPSDAPVQGQSYDRHSVSVREVSESFQGVSVTPLNPLNHL